MPVLGAVIPVVGREVPQHFSSLPPRDEGIKGANIDEAMPWKLAPDVSQSVCHRLDIMLRAPGG